jgi:hypothetical protein
VIYKVASGSEGATLSITGTGGGNGGYHIYRITGYQGVPVIAAASLGFSQPDPPNLTTGFGAVDTLWLACCFFGNVGASISAYSANYTNGSADVTASGNPGTVGTCRRNLNAASENPGAFTTNISPWMAAATIGIQGLTATPRSMAAIV